MPHLKPLVLSEFLLHHFVSLMFVIRPEVIVYLCHSPKTMFETVGVLTLSSIFYSSILYPQSILVNNLKILVGQVYGCPNKNYNENNHDQRIPSLT
jgi:hypothetical protein